MLRYAYIVCRVCNSDSRSIKETQTTILACGYERPVIQFRPGRSRQRTDPFVFQQQRKESRALPVQVVGPEMTDKTPYQRKHYLLLPCAISRILRTCTLFLYPSRKSQQQRCVFVWPRTRIAFGAMSDASWSLSTAVNSTRFVSVTDFHGTRQNLKVSQPVKKSSEFYGTQK
jgi:hypothetical protein